ncbi:MAG: hypothetical protein HC853_00335 [Anaerolineae bacterium]|nr:hypothetical protein [Anaerolineae bacterium]
MKLGLSRRNTDLDDQNVLFNAIIADLQPKSSDELWSRVAKYVPTERIESAKLKLIMMWSQR